MRVPVLAVVVALLLFPAMAQAQSAGNVVRVQGRAEAVDAGGGRVLAAGGVIRTGDRLRTGPAARLLVRFADGMELTLSDEAEMVVEDFSWIPARNEGKAALHLDRGSFLLETGMVGRLPGHPLAVRTPLASVGVRGTRFWGGPLDSLLNVLLLEGAIVVASPAGSVVLDQPGSGTAITAAGAAPTPPSFWGEDRIGRAVATVSFAP
ncbi:FecR domain-containing protein [Magnetospirillum sp. SS-4]|uniref:FecR family protein n=1 Tax=Magnetospirillum sp. SS-4 TaxID=2681465 RepID=UPI0013815AFB|nr:FecR domain-containing protein [Magnetospirillum sp. SS-4]CAA7615477.1 conserved exported hypothetical protein [Magnetospirillum sp. SS-4]